MPRSANAQPKCDGLPKLEWLFADRMLLSDEEIAAAYFWEFGLETPDVIAEVEAVREKLALSKKVDVEAVKKWRSLNPFPGVTDMKLLFEWNNKLTEQFPNYIVTTKFRNNDLHFLHMWPEFPSQHWLQVSEATRSDKKRLRPRLNDVVWSADIFNPHAWLKRGEAQKFDTVPSFFFEANLGLCCHTWIHTFMPPGIRFYRDWKDTAKSPWGFASADRWDEYHLVKINWARSDRKMKSDFAEWLKGNRPNDRQAYHKSKEGDSRRTTPRDLLKSLGALRLLRHFKGNWSKAADWFYSWRRECGRFHFQKAQSLAARRQKTFQFLRRLAAET